MRPAGPRWGLARATGRAGPLSEVSPTGRLLVGTSGFSYPAWSPRFYPPGLAAGDRLRHYASRFSACELNNTFYQRPTATKVAAWLAATPDGFRFAAKAQRGGSLRALLRDPATAVPWLTDPFRAFGDRLGAVLFRVPVDVTVDLARLDALLDAWPLDLPLVIEFEDPSWQLDEVHARLRAARAVLCVTQRPEDDVAPAIRLTGSSLYLRLRRHDYDETGIRGWADRLVPFLAARHDAFVFFRHDEVGRATELADALRLAVAARLPGLAPWPPVTNIA